MIYGTPSRSRRERHARSDAQLKPSCFSFIASGLICTQTRGDTVYRTFQLIITSGLRFVVHSRFNYRRRAVSMEPQLVRTFASITATVNYRLETSSRKQTRVINWSVLYKFPSDPRACQAEKAFTIVGPGKSSVSLRSPSRRS